MQKSRIFGEKQQAVFWEVFLLNQQTTRAGGLMGALCLTHDLSKSDNNMHDRYGKEAPGTSVFSISIKCF
jgi:hypothetical protein